MDWLTCVNVVGNRVAAAIVASWEKAAPPSQTLRPLILAIEGNKVTAGE